ncbi:MAG: hypothetical protein AB8G18_00075 [Gammaproteobacteria bacterium]
MKPVKHLLISLTIVVLSGCVSVNYPVEEVERARIGEIVSTNPEVLEQLAKISELEQALLRLGPDVDRLEAANIAGSSVNYSLELAEEYKLTKQPVIHNVLVNYGLKPRGLCIHFAEDLLRMLLAKNLRTFDVYWGVAYPTERFRLEHSSAVVTAKGQPFETGIVLDGWRNSGDLYFVRVPDDTRYTWELFDDKVTEEHRLKLKKQAEKTTPNNQ